MSNYIVGSVPLTAEQISSLPILLENIKSKSVLGFREIPASSLADEYIPFDYEEGFLFYISDDNRSDLSEYLLYEEDMSPDFDCGLPTRLQDRLALINRQVEIILEETQASYLLLWISVIDQLERTTEVKFSEFLNHLENEFSLRGIPCTLYKIDAS